MKTNKFHTFGLLWFYSSCKKCIHSLRDYVNHFEIWAKQVFANKGLENNNEICVYNYQWIGDCSIPSLNGGSVITAQQCIFTAIVMHQQVYSSYGSLNVTEAMISWLISIYQEEKNVILDIQWSTSMRHFSRLFLANPWNGLRKQSS